MTAARAKAGLRGSNRRGVHACRRNGRGLHPRRKAGAATLPHVFVCRAAACTPAGPSRAGSARVIPLASPAAGVGRGGGRAYGTVSIVIPSLNAAAHIAPCVESALNQTYRDTEIIVVDAGSTDGTLDILRRYGGRVRVVRDEGGSIPHSMNAAIGEMKGEWLRRVDSDDVAHPESVGALLAASDPDDPGSSIPYADYSRIDAGGRETGGEYRFPYNRLSTFEQGVRQIDHMFASSTSCLIHRSVFERAGPFDEGFAVAEDREFALRCLLLHGIRFANVPRVLYGYRVRDGQLTGDRPRMFAEGGRAVGHVLSRLPGGGRARYERAAREYGRLHGFMLGVWMHANGAAGPPGEAAAGAVRTTYASLLDAEERGRGRRWAAGNGGHPLVGACAGAAFGECHRMGSRAWALLEEAYRGGAAEEDGAGALG